MQVDSVGSSVLFMRPYVFQQGATFGVANLVGADWEREVRQRIVAYIASIMAEVRQQLASYLFLGLIATVLSNNTKHPWVMVIVIYGYGL